MSEQDSLQLVSFTLGGEMFGAPITKIREIIKYTNVVKIPKSPEFLEGIINLRGKVISVIDLKKRFNMPLSERQNQSRIVVAEISGARVGLAVDSVAKVIRVDAGSFEKTPAIVSGVSQKFVKGVVKERDGMLIVLDLDKLLTQEEIELLKRVD